MHKPTFTEPINQIQIIKKIIMQELINKVAENAGISAEQAATAVSTVKEFVKEKFPMLAGAVDTLFATAPSGDSFGSMAKPADEPLK
jgi:deoxyhypusine synthase